MDVHRCLNLRNQFAGFRVVDAEEATVISTRRDEPLAIVRKLHLFDESFVFVVFDFVNPLTFLPVEDLDPRWPAEMVDVPDRPDPTRRQEATVVRKRERTQAAN